MLDRDFFVTVFDAYSIMFFDPDWEFLVPDVRWFPARENSATRIATALVDGAPTSWLASSLRTAFPEDVALASQSVTVDADRAAAWKTMLQTWPNYAKYEERTDRIIPVFRLARR